MPLYKRSLLLTAAIPFLLGLNGLVFLGYEDIDEATSNDETDFLEYLWISFITSLIAWVFIIIIDFVTYKCENDNSNRKCGDVVFTVLIGFMFIFSALSVGFLIFEYCLDWSKIWCMLFLFSALISGLVLETITALIKVATKTRIS